MIYINGKEITQITVHQKAIAVIYQNGKMLWQAVRSCFGSGAWVNTKPWLYNEGWKNNK